MTRIAVIGTGYVGLVSGACLSDFGNTVTCVDIDKNKIEALDRGRISIYEPGLEDIVMRNRAEGRLRFSTESGTAIAASEVVFIAVGTPAASDGSPDMRYVRTAAAEIGRNISNYCVVVDKSTVPVGTARRVRSIIEEELRQTGRACEFDVVSNPEFLREGSAVYDFMHPDRVVFGVESEKASEVMRSIYRVLYLRDTPFIMTNLESAELIKYASNSYLALKIGFVNEIATLCEHVGGDVTDVMRALGRDGRIGPKFLHPGPGYGGSCLPKDTKALASLARGNGFPLSILDAVISSNEAQKARMVSKIEKAVGRLCGKTIAVLGLAFKPNTDDVRESPALTVVREMISRKAVVRAYDPAAMAEARREMASVADRIAWAAGEYEAAENADALVILTEWNQFRDLDLERLKAIMARPVLIDLRNIYNRRAVESAGFAYFGIGR